jgi:acetyl-CoA carboxylase beta subunit
MLSFENSPNLSSSYSKRKNIPDGLWNRCEVCGEITFSKELDRNFKICPKCGYHYPMSASERIRMLLASKSFIEYESSIPKAEGVPELAKDQRSEHICEYGLRSNPPLTPLPTPYPSKGGERKGLQSERTDVTSELVTAGEVRLHEYQIVLCIISSNPTDGSNIQFNLNKKEYEKVLYTFNKSLMKSMPLITFYADGTIVNLSSKYATPACAALVAAGRSIYEGGHIEPNDHKTKSLVSEANTTTRGEENSSEWLSFISLINLAAIVEKLSQKRIPHITVLTNPRVGSEFSTSFPLGDIVLAEPKPMNLRPTDNRKNNHKTKSLVSEAIASQARNKPKASVNEVNIITKNVLSSQLSPENYLIDRYVNRRDLKKNLTKILSFCIG